jgi:hypothetical protein
MDEALGAGSRLTEALRRAFSPPDGLVPRVVKIDTIGVSDRTDIGSISIVQDASVVSEAETGTAAQLLLKEISDATTAGANHIYLCCVNRGVLDDALIEALERKSEMARCLLETVTQAVSLFPNAPSCWPLDGFPEVAVWPMDVESLLTQPRSGEEPPAKKLIESALAEEKWKPHGDCPAGQWCPFCGSRNFLSREREQQSLLRILRWYEVASGQRWSFRDLFSLISYLLAGHRPSARGYEADPCDWAAALVLLDEQARRKAKPTQETSTALFQLVASQYHQALFHSWDRQVAKLLARDITELGLETDNTLRGLHWFLASRRGQYLPTTIGAALDAIVALMDPCLASPDSEVQATQRTAYRYREIDIRFSRSIAEGLDFVRKSQILSRVEIELLERLAHLDIELSRSAVRRKRPAAATRTQRISRDFACRIVRRTLGTRTGAVLDAQILSEFHQVTEDANGNDLHEVAREIERLLNAQHNFEISLTTTFGQPLPPPIQRAMLVVPARPVKALEETAINRPKSPIAYLKVGGGDASQPFALTYELFKAVKELKEGMSMASLPRTVLALLDTTRAKLSGSIVRDIDILDRAHIRLGSSGLIIEERRNGFMAHREG